jgi:hypothetical protein
MLFPRRKHETPDEPVHTAQRQSLVGTGALGSAGPVGFAGPMNQSAICPEASSYNSRSLSESSFRIAVTFDPPLPASQYRARRARPLALKVRKFRGSTARNWNNPAGLLLCTDLRHKTKAVGFPLCESAKS